MMINKLVISFLLVLFTHNSMSDSLIPLSPEDLIKGIDSNTFQSDSEYRKYLQSMSKYAIASEKNESDKPYTTAIGNYINSLNVEVFIDWPTIVPTNFTKKCAGKGEYRHIVSTFLASGSQKPIDLYLLMGQSNMQGTTNNTINNCGIDGPGPTIQQALQDYSPNSTVVVFNCARGGTSIDVWNPYTGKQFGSATDINENGVAVERRFFNLTEQCIEKARAYQNANGVKANIRGVFFSQGENEVGQAALDRDLTMITKWGDQYKKVVERLRNEFGYIPIVHAQHGRIDFDLRREGFADLIRNPDAMNAYIARLSESLSTMQQLQANLGIPYTDYIVTDDLELREGDDLHLSSKGQIGAGLRFAVKMMNLLDKQSQLTVNNDQ